MMATTARRSGQPGGSAGMDDLSSTHSGSLGEQDGSANGSIPENVDIVVMLPNGHEKPYHVEYHKQMMDFLVQVAVGNKLSPSSHTFSIINDENGRPVEFLPSQSIGSLGVSCIYLVQKGRREVRKAPIQPFEMTKRLTVNLPRNQKAVLRVNPNATLAELYKMICVEKSLDPYKYELRHPTHADEPLNMASPLQHYGINEITVVPVGPDTRRSTSDLPVTSGFNSDVTFSTIPRNKGAAAGPAPSGPADGDRGFMPGMEKKKKKGIFSIFSRKKGGKFNVSEASYGVESRVASSATMGPPPSHTSSLPRSRSEQPLQTQPLREAQPRPLSTYSTHSSLGGDSGSGKPIPDKPPRKKRPAPPPPPGTKTSLQVSTEASKPPQADPAHSRTSSHSSGFDETTSPLESPGNSSRDSTINHPGSNHIALTKSSNDATSIGSSDAIAAERANHVEAARPQEMNKQTSAASVASDSSTLSRTLKKKRKAPPPPGATKTVTSPPPEVTSPTEPEDTSPVYSAQSTPAHVSYDVAAVSSTADSSEPDTTNAQDALVDAQLKSALVEELKNGPIDNCPVQGQNDTEGQLQGDLQNGLALNNRLSEKADATQDEADQLEPSTEPPSRPCAFIAPPPPESPPPPQTPNSTPSQHPLRAANSVPVVDSTTQVHVTMRDSLSSEYSCCADDVSSDDEFPSDLNLGSSRSSAVSDFDVESVETNEHVFTTEPGSRKSEVAEFVEQMEELTENVSSHSSPDGDISTSEGAYKSVITINSDDVDVDLSHDQRGRDTPTSPVKSDRSDQGDFSVATDETSSMSSSTAMYIINAEKEEDSDEDLETLPQAETDGVVLLKKENIPISEFNEIPNLRSVVSKSRETHETNTYTVPDIPEYDDNKRDSVHSGDGVTAEEISFADEVMASIESRDQEDQKPTTVTTIAVEPPAHVEPRKKVLMPSLDDISMDEEITFDFDHSDVMFVPPTPPTKDLVKEEQKSGQFTDFIPEPIIESSLEVIEEQPPEVDHFRHDSDGFYEQTYATTTSTTYMVDPDPAFADLPPPPPELMENTQFVEQAHEAQDDTFTYTVTKNYSADPGPEQLEEQTMELPEEEEDDDDGFVVPVIPLPRRKADAAPAPVKEPEPVMTSLRDAYRKPEKKEPETIIINKDKPLPVFQAKLVRELPEKRRITLAANTPRFETHEKEETNSRIPVEPSEPTEEDRQKVSFWGPRPWNARAKSEPSIKDVRMALSRAQAEEETALEDVNHNQKGSRAREQITTIGYDPASAEENNSVLEEKSISLSMNTLPVTVERRSSYKEPSGLNRYGSSMGLVTGKSRPSNLESIPAQSPVRPDEADQTDKGKKSLSQQYGELQQNFGRWQQQLLQNQQLLAKQKIVPEEQGKPLESIAQPPAPPAQEPPRKVETVKRDSSSFVTSAARREERLSSSSSQSSVSGGLAGKFSPDELLSQKSLLKGSSMDEGSSIRFNGDGSSGARITRQLSAPLPNPPRESSPPRKITVAKTVSTPPVAPPPPPPVPSVNNPPPPPPVSQNIDRPVKSWGAKVTTKRPTPKFGPQLSPREELMLAIRGKGGRSGLRSTSSS